MANVSSSNGLEKYPKLRFKGFSEQYRIVPLGDIACEVSRTDPNSKAPVMMLSAGNGFIMQSEKYSRDNAGQSLKKYTLLKKGELAYNHGASKAKQFGCCYQLEVDEALVPFVYHCFSVNKEYAPYISTVLNISTTERQLKKLVSSSVRMDGLLNISYDDYMTVELALPSMDEQQKVSYFLSLLEEKIKKQQKLVEHLKKYKRGFLQASFSSQDDWNTYPISSLGKVVTGSTPPTDNPENYGGDELFCAPSDVGAEKYISSTIKRVSEKGFHTGRIVPKGTIIVTCIGLIGKLGIATQDMITNQQINSLIVNDAFDNEFIYYALEFALPRYAAQASMQTMPILSKSEFEKITLQIPNIKRQKEISQPLALLDNKIATQALVLENLIALKNGLLQKLFI